MYICMIIKLQPLKSEHATLYIVVEIDLQRLTNKVKIQAYSVWQNKKIYPATQVLDQGIHVTFVWLNACMGGWEQD